MIRNTVLGLVAAATLAVAMGTTASTASAGPRIQFHFTGPAYGYGHVYHAPYGHVAPSFGYYTCRNVVVGYRQVLTRYGWRTRPITRRHCGY